MKSPLTLFAVTALSAVQLIQSAPLPFAPMPTSKVLVQRATDTSEAFDGQQLLTRGVSAEGVLAATHDVVSGVAGEKMLNPSSSAGSASGLMADELKLTPTLESTSSGQHTHSKDHIIKWAGKDVSKIEPFIPQGHYGRPVVQTSRLPLEQRLQNINFKVLEMFEEKEVREQQLLRLLSKATDAHEILSLNAQLWSARQAKEALMAREASLRGQLRLTSIWHTVPE